MGEKVENKYEKSKKLSAKNFKRLIGVKRQTFAAMVEELQSSYEQKHRQGGRPSKLTVENQLMLALEYWRQYITFAELGFNYGVAESTAHDITVWVEDTLIKCGRFNLPGKKALLEDSDLEIVLLDVMETFIERPKKAKIKLFRQKEKAYDKDTDFCRQSHAIHHSNCSMQRKNSRFQVVQRRVWRCCCSVD